jgi:hypothetical protein
LQSDARFVGNAPKEPLNAGLVAEIYNVHIQSFGAADVGTNSRRARHQNARHTLELNSYLEYYLWPFYSQQATIEHVMSIVYVSIDANEPRAQ